MPENAVSSQELHSKALLENEMVMFKMWFFVFQVALKGPFNCLANTVIRAFFYTSLNHLCEKALNLSCGKIQILGIKKQLPVLGSCFLTNADWVLRQSVLRVVNVFYVDFLIRIPGSTQYRENIANIT